MKIIPTIIRLDFKMMRIARQNDNNDLVYNTMKSNNLIEFKKHINHKEFMRTLKESETPFDIFWKKCTEDELFAKVVAGRLSKCSSRQGTKDENEQLNTCNKTAQLCGINITLLTTTELRPVKNGTIVSRKEMISKKIEKNNCLKSFDAKISGKMNGFIAAKVAFGSGGHQDNVFEEMDVLAHWWSLYKNDSDEFLVVLIDTDLTEKFQVLRKKYETVKNIKVFDHCDLQTYVIDHYYKEPVSATAEDEAVEESADDKLVDKLDDSI
jgi:hypothetical protein